MSRVVNTEKLCEIAIVEFHDIVIDAFTRRLNEARIILTDGSFIDVWFSLKLSGRYSYHWERQAIDGTIYRHDNAPHKRWETVATFPHHFHNGSELNVTESHLSELPAEAIQQFLAFARSKLTTRK